MWESISNYRKTVLDVYMDGAMHVVSTHKVVVLTNEDEYQMMACAVAVSSALQFLQRCISYSNSVCLSVCPCVRPSVRHTPVLCQNGGT